MSIGFKTELRRGGHGPRRACSWARLAGLSKWRAGLKILKICPRACGLAHVLCCIFYSFRVKNKGKERSARGLAHADSCRCGLEIIFFDRDRPATHIADNGPGLERARAGPAHAHLFQSLLVEIDLFTKGRKIITFIS